jgi:hypothetical protein
MKVYATRTLEVKLPFSEIWIISTAILVKGQEPADRQIFSQILPHSSHLLFLTFPQACTR